MTEQDAGAPGAIVGQGLQAGFTAATEAAQDAAKGVAGKQKGLMQASKGKDGLVLMAQRVAMELGANGAVTIDDVVEALNKKGLDHPGKRKRMWHGKVFLTSKWICVGTMPSRFAANNARDVKVWVLKTWLDANGLNGTDYKISAFRTGRIYDDFKRANPGIIEERCNWIIGTERLGDEVAQNIKMGGNFLYGIPVTFVPGSVGAMLQPYRDYVRPIPAQPKV